MYVWCSQNENTSLILEYLIIFYFLVVLSPPNWRHALSHSGFLKNCECGNVERSTVDAQVVDRQDKPGSVAV